MTSSPSGFSSGNPEIKQLFPASRNQWAGGFLAGSNVVVFSCWSGLLKMYILFPDEKSKILSEEGGFAGLVLVVSHAREPSPRIACVYLTLGTAVPSR